MSVDSRYGGIGGSGAGIVDAEAERRCNGRWTPATLGLDAYGDRRPKGASQ
jgi:hypothetical protein